MRIELALNAIADAEYDTAAHHKLRGRIWRGLEDKERYADIHDTDHGVGFSFSNVFPWGNIQEGEQRCLRIASPRRAILDDLVAHFETDRSFDVGQMRFEVDDITGHTPHVGEPGATGEITTGTGVFCAFGPEQANEYGLDTSKMQDGESTTDLFWRPKHGMGPLQDTMRRSLQQTHQLYGDEYYDGPIEVGDPLFERVEPIKDDVTYVVRFKPTADVTRTVLLSKWRLGYRVRDETHRYHLNLALDAGLGQRREHGFGFLNLRNQTPPRAEAG